MRGRGDWVILALLVTASAILVLISSSRQGDSAEHSSNNDGFHGTSALRLLAGAKGHPTSQLDLAFNPQPGAALLVFSPTTPFTAAEARVLADYVQAGGIAVYADEQLDPQIAAHFKLRLSTQPIPTLASAATPVFANVRNVGDETTSRYWMPGADQAVLLRHPTGQPLAIEMRVGSGRLIAFSAPCLLCNGYIRNADNAVLAADVVSLAQPGAPVVFDEYHHGALAAGTAGDWATTPYGLATWWAVIILFVGLAVRGRAFGPRLPAPGARDRSSAEYAVAVGRLLRQSGARKLALRLALEAASRQVALRIGLRRDTPAATFVSVLEQRAPELANRFAQATEAAAEPHLNEAALLRAARLLHELAYPIGRTGE